MKILKLILITLLTLTFACTDDDNIISDFYIYPNPYNIPNGEGTFRLTLNNSITDDFTLKIEVKDQRNQIVWTRTKDYPNSGNTINLKWSGLNNSGILPSPGIYRAKVTISGTASGEKYFELIIQ